jgi:hypothetical protein
VFRRDRPSWTYRPGMERRSLPRSLVSRALLAVGLFALAVVPAWTLGGLAEDWTGWGLLDWLVTCAGNAAAVSLLAPLASYRPRDGWLGLIPVYGWYLTCALLAGGAAAVPGLGTAGRRAVAGPLADRPPARLLAGRSGAGRRAPAGQIRDRPSSRSPAQVSTQPPPLGVLYGAASASSRSAASRYGITLP